jgi:autotransporter passenger strand-loop-strand repeat protein
LIGATISAGNIIVAAGAQSVSGVTAIGANAELDVSSGVTATSTVLSNGGTLELYSGATGQSTFVGTSGLEVVNAGATAFGTTVSGVSGTSFIYGTETGVMLESGSIQKVYSGGVVSNVAITGGTLVVSSGAAMAGSATLSGGLIEIQVGGSAGGVGFSSAGGTLQLDDSNHFSSMISGFGVPGGIDLRDIAFNSATTTLGYSGDASSGILTVSDGVHSANIHLLGQYTAGNFTIQTDGLGGTLVTDPPLGGVSSVTSPHG